MGREVHVAGEEAPPLVPDDAQAGSNRNKVSHKDLKKNMTIEYIDQGNRKTGYIVSRAGKVGSKKGKGKEGKYEHYWNVQDIESGHISVVDAKHLEEISRIDKDQEAVTEDEEVEEVYAVNIPWNRHGEQKCRKAKEVELDRFDEFDAYEEVEYKGQETLATSWVLVEKVKAGETIVKARLVVRGDQEDTSDVQTDSPTVRKGNINFVLMISARNGWVVKSQDITAAFLQSVPIERDVFVRPPPERRVPGVIWKLKKTVYGLVDASRGFYLNLSGELINNGCEKSKMDPAMFLYFGENNDEVSKEPSGVAVTHVDDVLSGGNTEFETNVMTRIKKTFKFGSEEELEFRYVGINIAQCEEGFMTDNNHYVQALELPCMEVAKNLKMEELLDHRGQTEFRSVIGKLTALAHTSRPDICFDVKILSSKFNKATKKDLQTACKRMIKVKSEETFIKYPDLGMDITEWILVGHGDCGLKSMPDKITSVGGYVVMLCNKRTNACCVLVWKSKKIRRKVISTLAGEALAMIGVIGEIVYTKAVLVQMFGTRAKDIPTLVLSDCKNLTQAIKSTSLVEDPWLIPDIAVIKDALEDKTVSEVRWVCSKDMMADCLTKAGASGSSLMHVLESGRYEVPGGW